MIHLQSGAANAVLFKDKAVKEQIASLNGKPLKQLLDKTLSQIDLEKDSGEWLSRAVELVTLEKLEEAVLSDHPDAVGALETAKSLYREAQYYLEATQETSPTIRTRINSLLNSLISVLESILNAFGVADFFKPAESEIHAEFKGQKIMMLMSLFTMLTGILVPVVGAALCGMILGATLLSIAALSLIYPYFRPTPSILPQGENWTQACQKGLLPAADGRKESLNEIAQTLISSKNAKTHVMLLGKTGVGKTETAKAFAQAVERGDYPELKGKKIFYFNTADLVNGSEMFNNGNKILSRISQEMGRHRENFILILDEIHLACQKKERTDIGEQLKTYLDNGKQNFPYVIAITTEEEYYRDIYVNHAAFARRFKRITIQNTEDAETVKILNRFLLKQAPKAILEPNAVPTLLKMTKEAFGEQTAQPASSLKILSQCVKKTAESQKSPLDAKIEQARIRLQSIISQGAVEFKSSVEKDKECAELETRLRTLEEDFKREKGDLDRLFRMRDQLAETKASLFRNAADLSALAQKNLSSRQKKKLSRFFFETRFLVPALERQIHSEAKRIGAQISIDSKLIGQVIQSELENDKKAQKIVRKGKEQLETRVKN